MVFGHGFQDTRCPMVPACHLKWQVTKLQKPVSECIRWFTVMEKSTLVENDQRAELPGEELSKSHRQSSKGNNNETWNGSPSAKRRPSQEQTETENILSSVAGQQKPTKYVLNSQTGTLLSLRLMWIQMILHKSKTVSLPTTRPQ